MSAPSRCDLCGRSGLLYLVEGRPCCPSCMYRQRPPLEYAGPERRSSPVPTLFTRRSEDVRRGRTFSR
ncbi:MAG TPA: hypothetical protein VFS34_07725 [Thermoanaerobaculia bacterium]|nr:hypothetical protein [Thermoanaerobaculia bacterium]